MKLIFDVYPMLNATYTGIPQTTWHLAKYLRTNLIDCLFTVGYRVLATEEIDELITARSGQGFQEALAVTPGPGLSTSDLEERIYFSPHVMSINSRRCVGNARIVHDMSSVTLPEFHNPDVVRIDGSNLRIDIALCDCLFTVSNSSRLELIRYLGVPEEKITVVYPGVEWQPSQWDYASKRLFDGSYVLLLSTREPRKNLNLVFDYLTKNIESILRGELLYVFAGPAGWGRDHVTDAHHPIKKLVDSGKLIFAGFVPEELKLSLMANARFLIFPSYFEGFGSPVAEALSLGTPVLCSFGGSLPEVGGTAARYFSPESLESLETGLLELEFALSRDPARERKASLEQGQKFTWDAFCKGIFGKLEDLYRSRQLKGGVPSLGSPA